MLDTTSATNAVQRTMCPLTNLPPKIKTPWDIWIMVMFKCQLQHCSKVVSNGETGTSAEIRNTRKLSIDQVKNPALTNWDLKMAAKLVTLYCISQSSSSIFVLSILLLCTCTVAKILIANCLFYFGVTCASLRLPHCATTDWLASCSCQR